MDRALGITCSNWRLTAPPHKRLAKDQPWSRGEFRVGQCGGRTRGAGVSQEAGDLSRGENLAKRGEKYGDSEFSRGENDGTLLARFK